MAKPPPQKLPPKYYLEHFAFFLSFLEAHYGHILNEQEKQFIESYRGLKEDTQCLVVRMANRRGEFFLLDKFNYQEISNLSEARKEAERKQLLRSLSVDDEVFYDTILHLFPKAFLYKLAKEFSLMVKSSDAKAALVDSIYEQVPFLDALYFINTFHDLVFCTYGTIHQFFLFLFFGNTYEDLTQFVVRDIGYIKYEETGGEFTPLFSSRKAAEDKLLVLDAMDYFRVLSEEADPNEVYSWFENWVAGKLEELCEEAHSALGKLTVRVARWLERKDWLVEALSIYKNTNRPPATERRIRILSKIGEEEEALVLAIALQEKGTTAEERLFAKDFLDKASSKKRRLKRTTQRLKAADEIQISNRFIHQVEAGVAQHFSSQGYEAVFSENHLWRSLFGLVFWEEVFSAESLSFHHPLQRRPSDLKQHDFLANREEAIQEKITILESPKAFYKQIHDIFEHKQGIANPFVSWSSDILGWISMLYERVPSEALQKVLWEIAKDPKENGRGFPDLFLWNYDGYEFIEVKSPNDHLGPQQWYWFSFFEKVKIKARIVRVAWSSGDSFLEE